jgi:hypothetical protein
MACHQPLRQVQMNPSDLFSCSYTRCTWGPSVPFPCPLGAPRIAMEADGLPVKQVYAHHHMHKRTQEALNTFRPPSARTSIVSNISDLAKSQGSTSTHRSRISAPNNRHIHGGSLNMAGDVVTCVCGDRAVRYVAETFYACVSLCNVTCDRLHPLCDGALSDYVTTSEVFALIAEYLTSSLPILEIQ